VRNIRFDLAAAAALMIACSAVVPALAQSQWFVPKTASEPVAPAPGPRASKAAAARAPVAGAPAAQVGLPALPALPQIERGATPPAAVIGVLDVSGVLRSSSAYQAVQKEMAARKAALDADAQKEQSVWREMNQALTDQQKTLPADQLAAKQKALQDRVNDATKQFQTRDQHNQDAANYAFAQIQQVLTSILNQVAESHGMNMVLYQNQVVLSVREFDISVQVAQELNQVLPSVLIPPDGADVAAFARAHEVKAKK
jgi:Skp family chaperone for outer membrane proteins